MLEVKVRLLECVSAVFPDLTIEEATHASKASIASWDSLATATLITVVEEEFDIQLDPEDMDEFISFDLIEDVVNRKVGAS